MSTTKTKVVRIKRQKGEIVQDCDVYCGRKCSMGGWNLKTSIWHNPYSIKECGTREACLEAFEKYLINNKHLMEKIHTLKGKTLGCWCKPERCHCDILAKYADSA